MFNNAGAIIIDPQKATPSPKTHHTMHSSTFYPTPKVVCFTMHFNPKSTPFRGAFTPHVIHVPWSLTEHPKMHLDCLAVFAQLRAESTCTL